MKQTLERQQKRAINLKFFKINEIDKTLARLRERREDSNKIISKRGDITTDPQNYTGS